jgi:hypothetical protein
LITSAFFHIIGENVTIIAKTIYVQIYDEEVKENIQEEYRE